MPALPTRQARAEATLPFLTHNWEGQVKPSSDLAIRSPVSTRISSFGSSRIRRQRQIQLESLILAQNER